MYRTKESFLKGVMERLLGNQDTEVSLYETYLYMKQSIPIEELHLHCYDPKLDLHRILMKATDSGAKKTNMVLPLTEEDLTRLLDPNIPDEERFEIDKEFPSLIRHNAGLSGVWVMVLKLKKKELFGTVCVLSKPAYNYTDADLELFSAIKKPFTSFLYNLVHSNKLPYLKKSIESGVFSIQQWKKYISENEIIGHMDGLKQVLEKARQVSLFDSPVILLGETGVGKEMVARLIHGLSSRSNRLFMPVNCGAIPDTLIDSELFGHEKGAFTGATSSQKGIFEVADGGTVFLDEIGELSLHAQVRMLRVLQEKKIQRVGSAMSINVDMRIIAATHENLDRMIKNGQFRMDLWFRLHVFTLMLPPLRERKKDIPCLLNYFLQKKSILLGIPVPLPADDDAIAPLLDYDWPGNVRELENVAERALILSNGRPIDFYRILRGDSTLFPKQTEYQSEKEVYNLDQVVSRHIRRVLKLCGGKINGHGGAAEKLGVHPATLRHRMKKLGILYGKKVLFM